MPQFGLVEEVEVRDSLKASAVLPKALGHEVELPTSQSYRPAGDRWNRDEVISQWRSRIAALVDRDTSAAQTMESPTTYVRLAQSQYSLGDNEGAARSAKKAIDIASAWVVDEPSLKDSPAVYAAAQILANAGFREMAIELLRSYPRGRVLNVALANLLLVAGELGEVSKLLEDADDGVAEAIRGYVYMEDGQYPKAIAALRSALRSNPDDADSAINLAIAYWRMGARKKALRGALRATRSSPGRADLSINYLQFLVDSHEYQRARGEVKWIKNQGVIDSTPLVLLQARIAYSLGEVKEGDALLERSRTLARSEGLDQVDREITANQAVIAYVRGEIDRQEARRQLRLLLEKDNSSWPILEMWSDLTHRVGEGPDLQKFADTFCGELTTANAHHLASRIAFIKCDFSAALEHSLKWVAEDRCNDSAASSTVLLLGQVTDDWQRAATMAKSLVPRAHLSRYVANNVAYALAMGGMPTDALRVIDRCPDLGTDYVLQATKGLAHLAAGEIDEGLREYRLAADMADAESPDRWTRSLMALHQCLGLARLGLLSTAEPARLRAGALADAGLPDDWKDRPAFVILYEVCKRLGYEWPLVIE